MTFSTDEVALVTGAGSGIGKATALAFARAGVKVVVADIHADSAETTAQQIRASGGDALSVQADVSQADSVQEMITRVIDTYGRLDYAFNNAGIEGTPFVPTADITEDTWDSVLNVNLKGVWLCMKYQIPQMLKQGKGAIVNTASVAGLRAAPNAGSAYSASKFAVIGLTKTAAVEYASRGIRINAVCPAVINTAMIDRSIKDMPHLRERLTAAHPIGRCGEPDDVASAVLMLCSDAAGFVTGHALPVDGGMLA